MEEAERLNEAALADMQWRQRNDQFRRTTALKYGVIGRQLQICIVPSPPTAASIIHHSIVHSRHWV